MSGRAVNLIVHFCTSVEVEREHLHTLDIVKTDCRLFPCDTPLRSARGKRFVQFLEHGAELDVLGVIDFVAFRASLDALEKLADARKFFVCLLLKLVLHILVKRSHFFDFGNSSNLPVQVRNARSIRTYIEKSMAKLCHKIIVYSGEIDVNPMFYQIPAGFI